MKEEFDKRLSPFYFKTGLINLKICTCDFLILFTISHIFLLKKLDFKTVQKNRVCVGVLVVAEIAPRLPMSLLRE
jgi:hypothetical protein